MKRIVLSLLLLSVSTLCVKVAADEQQSTPYFLPKTALKFIFKIEKTTYTPGEFAVYAPRFFRLNPGLEKTTTYRILSYTLQQYAVPDTSKAFTFKVDAKRNIRVIHTNDGMLLAINADPKEPKQVQPFVPARKPAPLDPHAYMSQDILSAGSKIKQAELTAQEILDIRDSRNQLNRGQADFNPKDGEQLKVMLQENDTQEKALMQLFTGVTLKDTSEVSVDFVPDKKVTKTLLFRFSKKLGMVDSDDLAGAPYYVTVEDEHLIPDSKTGWTEGRKNKDDAGLYSNLPGRISVKVLKGSQPLSAHEIYAAQYGKVEPIPGDLFTKKLFTSVVLNPVTGYIDSIQTEETR